MRASTKFTSLLLVGSTVTLGLAGCEKLMPSPGTQCLESFRTDLKDPESGKVLSFENGLLTYTATNSYGARIQGKAICELVNDKWIRMRGRERILVLDKMTEKIEAQTKCMQSTKVQGECGLPLGTDLSRLEQITAQEMGF